MRLIVVSLMLLSVASVVGWAPGATADHFGTYSSSSAPSETPLLPLTSGVTDLALSDDSMTATFGMPFTIEFFGEPTSFFWVSANGFLTMFSADTSCTNPTCEGDPIPTADGVTTGMIAGFWTDLKPNLGGTVRFTTSETVAGVPALIVEYANVPGPVGTDANTFQVVVRSDEIIEVRIASVAASGGKAATIGLESCEFCGGDLAGVQHARGAALALANEIITFTPGQAPPPPPGPDLCLGGNATGCGPLTATRGASTSWFLTLRLRNLGATAIEDARIEFSATPREGPLNGLEEPTPTTFCAQRIGPVAPGETRLMSCSWLAPTRIGEYDFTATGSVLAPAGDIPGNNVATTTSAFLAAGFGGTTV